MPSFFVSKKNQRLCCSQEDFVFTNVEDRDHSVLFTVSMNAIYRMKTGTSRFSTVHNIGAKDMSVRSFAIKMSWKVNGLPWKQG